MQKFNPLTTFQGLTLLELRDIVKNREVYIWGAGFIGRCIRIALEKNGFKIKAFLDNNRNLKIVDNLSVFTPSERLEMIKNENSFLISVISAQSKIIEEECNKSGLEKNKNFLLYNQIPRQQAVIEISNTCNYFCTVCEKKDRGIPAFMGFDTYKKILYKLLKECPLLINIDLSLWFEPLSNPYVSEIVKETEKYLPCRLNTKLQDVENLEDVIKSAPSELILSCSGYEYSYEKNQDDSWSLFLLNLHKLQEYIERYRVKTNVSILYILYTNNNTDDFNKIKILGGKLGFTVITDTGYLSPYDNFFDLCEGRELSRQITQKKEILPWNLNRVLEACQQDAVNPCICQRIFPIINFDLSVSLCHLFCKPSVTNNFLDLTYKQILELRHNHVFCKNCQYYGLHRLDVDMLKRKHPEMKYNK